MSTVYIQEPATKGKLVIHTNQGPIDVELWSKEAPKTTRHFLQLALQGYYKNTLFHRLIPKFILQGGESPNRKETEIRKPLTKELHPRLRFVRRGLIAMATYDQFFITLSNTEHLQGQYTIFGKVVGDSLFNVLEMANQSVDANECPSRPPQILSIEVLENPYQDLSIIQPLLPPPTSSSPKTSSTTTLKKKKRPQHALLSFGDDQGPETFQNEKKIKSAYDLLPNLIQEKKNTSSMSSRTTPLATPNSTFTSSPSAQTSLSNVNNTPSSKPLASLALLSTFPSTSQPLPTSTSPKVHSLLNNLNSPSSLEKQKTKKDTSSSSSSLFNLSISDPSLSQNNLLDVNALDDVELSKGEFSSTSSRPSSVSSWRAALSTYLQHRAPPSTQVLTHLAQFQKKLQSTSKNSNSSSSSSSSSLAIEKFKEGKEEEEDVNDQGWWTHTLKSMSPKLGRDRLIQQNDKKGKAVEYDEDPYIVIDTRLRKKELQKLDQQRKLLKEERKDRIIERRRKS